VEWSIAPPFFTWTLGGVVSFMLPPLYHLLKAASTHWIGRCMSLRGGLDYVEEKKYIASTRKRTPAYQSVNCSCTD
jgi:hypothetical protein